MISLSGYRTIVCGEGYVHRNVLLNGHIVKLSYIKLKRNDSAWFYGFIHMEVNCKYCSTSAERLCRHYCHKDCLTRTCSCIGNNHTTVAYHALPDITLGETAIGYGKHTFIIVYGDCESMGFIFSCDGKCYRHISAGGCCDVFNAENNITMLSLSSYRTIVCGEGDGCRCGLFNRHIVEFTYFKLKRNSYAGFYGFIHMEIHCKYCSASTE